MAKFCRFIVNLSIICFLLAGLALLVPQFVGITTVVVDEGIDDTNLSKGSVVYGESVSLSELEEGDSLLRNTNTSVYVSKIRIIDQDTGVYSVVASDGTLEEVTLRRTADKVLFTVPVIGYMSIAMQSFEGRIILGLILALLVILFILSEIWRNQDEEDEEDEDEADRRYGLRIEVQTDEESKEVSPVEQAQDEGLSKKPEEIAEEDTAQEGEPVQELVLQPVEESEDAKLQDQAADLEETAEEVSAEEAEAEEIIPEGVGTDDATLGDMISEEPLSEEAMPEEEIPELDETMLALEAAVLGELDKVVSDVENPETAESEMELETPDEPQEPQEPKKLAIPALTADEWLERAAAAGDAPTLVEDQESGITFVDYSDIL